MSIDDNRVRLNRYDPDLFYNPPPGYPPIESAQSRARREYNEEVARILQHDRRSISQTPRPTFASQNSFTLTTTGGTNTIPPGVYYTSDLEWENTTIPRPIPQNDYPRDNTPNPGDGFLVESIRYRKEEIDTQISNWVKENLQINIKVSTTQTHLEVTTTLSNKVTGEEISQDVDQIELKDLQNDE